MCVCVGGGDENLQPRILFVRFFFLLTVYPYFRESYLLISSHSHLFIYLPGQLEDHPGELPQALARRTVPIFSSPDLLYW